MIAAILIGLFLAGVANGIVELVREHRRSRLCPVPRPSYDDMAADVTREREVGRFYLARIRAAEVHR